MPTSLARNTAVFVDWVEPAKGRPAAVGVTATLSLSSTVHCVTSALLSICFGERDGFRL
jgi:hypothetical protein